MTAPRSPFCPNSDCASARLVRMYGCILAAMPFIITVAFLVGVVIGKVW